MQWENPTAYADKMRMAANLDEIIATADEVYREPANHKNAEAFNRGQIKIRVGTNAYEADVLTAIKPDTREIFYDIVNIKATKIEMVIFIWKKSCSLIWLIFFIFYKVAPFFSFRYKI